MPGHPASTNHGLTLAQLRYHREVLNPLSPDHPRGPAGGALALRGGGAEQARRSSALRSQLENQLKRLRGQQAGLQDPAVLARKEQEEGSCFRRCVPGPSPSGRGDSHPIARIEARLR